MVLENSFNRQLSNLISYLPKKLGKQNSWFPAFERWKNRWTWMPICLQSGSRFPLPCTWWAVSRNFVFTKSPKIYLSNDELEDDCRLRIGWWKSNGIVNLIMSCSNVKLSPRIKSFNMFPCKPIKLHSKLEKLPLILPLKVGNYIDHRRVPRRLFERLKKRRPNL